MSVTIRDLEKVGVRPVPKQADRASAGGFASRVSAHLAKHGVQPRGSGAKAREGIWVFALVPHTARVEIIVGNRVVRQRVIDRVREVLTAGGYDVSTTDYTGKVVIYATKNAPDPRGQGRKTRGDL